MGSGGIQRGGGARRAREMVGLNKEQGYRTGDEPDGDEDEQRGAQVGREDLALRQLQRHEARQLQLRRRVGVPH